MSTPRLDIKDIMKRREELIEIIEEGSTAGKQIELYNRLIVLKVGNKALPGDNGAEAGAAQADEAEADPTRRSYGTIPGRFIDCPVEGCDSTLNGTKWQTLASGWAAHRKAIHPRLSIKMSDELKEQLREEFEAQ